jgi:predicted metal-binding protein
MVKVAVIGCKKQQNVNCISKDLIAVTKGTGQFKEIGPSELTGFLSCGGCPGKKTIERARLLTRAGADIVALSSGLEDEGFSCPYRDKLRIDLDRRFPSTIVLGSTY